MNRPETVARLARAFCDDLRANLTPEQLDDCRRRAEPASSWCPTHDYIDANECMAAAFETCGVEDEEGIWCSAWTSAMIAGYDAKRVTVRA